MTPQEIFTDMKYAFDDPRSWDNLVTLLDNTRYDGTPARPRELIFQIHQNGRNNRKNDALLAELAMLPEMENK